MISHATQLQMRTGCAHLYLASRRQGLPQSIVVRDIMTAEAFASFTNAKSRLNPWPNKELTLSIHLPSKRLAKLSTFDAYLDNVQ